MLSDMGLPEEVIAVCWKHDIHGRIYIPSPNKATKLEQLTRNILAEMEGVYEELGTTFVQEQSSRKVFSKFTIEQIRKRHQVAYETARQAAKRSRQRWAFWFNKHEAAILECISSKERFLYLRIRGLLRAGKPYGHINHIFKGMEITSLIEMAEQSIARCPWRQTSASN